MHMEIEFLIRQLIRLFTLCGLLMLITSVAWCHIELGSVFTSNMVVQRDQPIPIWGTASPSELVTVRFGKYSSHCVASPEGTWRVLFRPLRAQNRPEDLVVTGSNTITLTNIVIGDIWICSGQSNMEFPLIAAHDGDQVAAAATNPSIRLFTVAKNPSPIPLDTMGGTWNICTPGTAASFSAVGYFFGRELNQQLDVPIGLINTSWGGMPAETYTPAAALKALPQYSAAMAASDANILDFAVHKALYASRRDAEVKDYNKRLAAWYENNLATDPGTVGQWAAPSHSTADWKNVAVPVAPGNNPLGAYVGSIWTRKTVQIPDGWVGKDLIVHVGAVDDVDDTYVNGVHVGRLWYDVPGFWTLPRAYPVAAATVNSTSLTVTVLAFNLVGDIGLFGPSPEMYVAPAGDDSTRVSLAGDWAYMNGRR